MPTLLITPGPVTIVTLNRPDVRNALDEASIDALHAWASGVPADGSVRVAVLQGAGPVFCAGADLRWMAKMAGCPRDENLADARRAARMFLALDDLPVPLIGRVHGAAMGGGVGLAAVCDIVVAAEDARFGLSETTLGLVPATIAPYLVRKMGLSAVRALGLNGQPFDAARAMTVGLAHEIVPAADLDAAIARVVAGFAKAAPAAVRATKRLFQQVHGRAPADVAALTAEIIAGARVSPEGQEGMRAFLEKRPSAWTAELAPPDAASDAVPRAMPAPRAGAMPPRRRP
jgi:methylglutaconyl-CoA hydratase